MTYNLQFFVRITVSMDPLCTRHPYNHNRGFHTNKTFHAWELGGFSFVKQQHVTNCVSVTIMSSVDCSNLLYLTVYCSVFSNNIVHYRYMVSVFAYRIALPETCRYAVVTQDSLNASKIK